MFKGTVYIRNACTIHKCLRVPLQENENSLILNTLKIFAGNFKINIYVFCIRIVCRYIEKLFKIKLYMILFRA